MLSYIVRRLFYAALTLIGITVATFVLIHAVPGDPISFFAARSMRNLSPAAVSAIRHEYHLDEPLAVQYAIWAHGLLRGDFGRSTTDRAPVLDHIAVKLPNTVILNLAALLIAAFIGVPVGLWSATRSGRRIDRASSILFFLLYSLPSFWIALLLTEWLVVRWDLLPLFGMHSDEFASMTLTQKLIDSVRHLLLPVAVLAYGQLAIFARFSRAALGEVITQDFITTARAKGAGEARVVLGHALRNALIPLVTLLGLTIPTLMSGSVIVESIFQWDGIGLLYYQSILARDYPTVLGLTVGTAVITLLVSVAADVLYGMVDPRVRIAGRNG